MLTVKVFAIEKSQADNWHEAIEYYVRLSSRYSKSQSIACFDKQTQIAQAAGDVQAKQAYSKLLAPYLDGAFSVCMDEGGVLMDSTQFASLLDGRHSEVRFFIGGAYGFSNEFASKCNMKLSLSKMTMPHQLAKVVLWEQIYRGLAINASHPYHKQ